MHMCIYLHAMHVDTIEMLLLHCICAAILMSEGKRVPVAESFKKLGLRKNAVRYAVHNESIFGYSKPTAVQLYIYDISSSIMHFLRFARYIRTYVSRSYVGFEV